MCVLLETQPPVYSSRPTVLRACGLAKRRIYSFVKVISICANTLSRRRTPDTVPDGAEFTAQRRDRKQGRSMAVGAAQDQKTGPHQVRPRRPRDGVAILSSKRPPGSFRKESNVAFVFYKLTPAAA